LVFVELVTPVTPDKLITRVILSVTDDIANCLLSSFNPLVAGRFSINIFSPVIKA